jgi:trans-aconitate 2-methyltransferase
MTFEATPLNDWNARQYLRFEDERTRPARDLLAQVPLQQARRVVDLGCGPGNSTELLVERFPDATVTGVDASKDMLRMARERLPRCVFVEADIANWIPREPLDLVFANAVLQWVPNHQGVMARVLEALPEGGVLAVQMPDNTREPSHACIREVARREPWAKSLASAEAARPDLPSPESYYDLLKPLCRRIEIWHTVYEHVMDGPKAIVEWFKGSTLLPYLSALDASTANDFLEAYTAEIARHYPPRFDGQILLRFPRLFVVATR